MRVMAPRRSRSRSLLLLVVAIAVGIAACQGQPGDGPRGEAAAATRSAARVVRVVDGDTLIVRGWPTGAARRVRLIGIDTPER